MHYYVQAQKEGELPEIVYHTYNEKKKEYYYKFLDRKKAKALAEAEKKITPDVAGSIKLKFQIIILKVIVLYFMLSFSFSNVYALDLEFYGALPCDDLATKLEEKSKKFVQTTRNLSVSGWKDKAER